MLGLLIFCGAFIFEAQAFIGGQTVSSISDHPYACSIRHSESDDYLCMCTLIDNKWAITLADCITDYPRWKLHVVSGMLSRADSTVSKHSLKNYIVHENYTLEDTGNVNNIAILELDTPVTLPGFRGALIPENKDVIEDCLMISYGNNHDDCVNIHRGCIVNTQDRCDEEGTDYYHKFCKHTCHFCPEKESPLQEIPMMQLPGPRCEKFAQTKHPLTNDMVCAGASVLKQRPFDDAAPLICKSNSKDYVVGMLLQSQERTYKDNENLPGSFYGVYSYSKWISKITGLN